MRIHRRCLPHWRTDGGAYFVTARLADSLPAHALSLLKEKRSAVRDLKDRRRVWALSERFLDAGRGSVLLKRAECAGIVERVLRDGDGTRYRLGTWVIMPNHLHTIVKPLGAFSLDRIIGDWKSVTAHQINRLMGRRGSLWQGESYDSWLRDEHDLHRVRRYVLQNPIKAHLIDWKWVGDPDLTGILD